MTKKLIFIITLISFAMPIKAQDLIQKSLELRQRTQEFLTKNRERFSPEELKYLENIRKCGLPKLTDYYCHDYWTLQPESPAPLPKSGFYNEFKIKAPDSVAMELARTTAFLVIKDDSIIFENYYLGFDSSSVMNSFSMAKTITSLLIGKALDLGIIKSLDEQANKYLPWLNTPKDSLLRIKDLLNMASGLDWNEDFLNPLSDIVKAYYGYPLDSLLPEIHVKYPPNYKWNYQCVNYILAGLIIEKASGMSLGEFTQTYLWTPMGAENHALWGRDKKSGIPRSFCCMYATPRDYAKLGLIVLHKGYWNGKQIIPASYIEQMFEPASQLKYKFLKHNDFYKLGLWIYPRKKYEAYYFAGVFGQYIFVLPEQNAVIVRLGQMVNQLDVMRVPPDVPLYLKIGTNIIKQYEKKKNSK